MNEEAKRWQQDTKRAFDWIARVYDTAHPAWEDADAHFGAHGWKPQSGTGMGGCTASTTLSEWPFTYLKVMTATPEGVSSEDDSGKAAFFGFLFYDSVREGPVCFAGACRWSSAKAWFDHWAFYYALGGPGVNEGGFRATGDVIQSATPKNKTDYVGIDEIRWFEIPLANLNSADRLRDVVNAAMAMVNGDEEPAKAVCAGL